MSADGIALLIKFPRRYRCPPPNDAVPQGRERHITVYPSDGKWALMQTDEGGGHISGGMTKRQAVSFGIELVLEYCATLEVRNTALDDETAGGAA
jgi:hypothetical protein